jgi:hypothetical protein
VLAECSKEDGELTVYVDGESTGTAPSVPAELSLANDADLYVGGTPGGGNLACTIDFMRIALGTLEQSRTSIDELHAWQFNGPFLRDFLGREPEGKREAGALELR